MKWKLFNTDSASLSSCFPAWSKLRLRTAATRIRCPVRWRSSRAPNTWFECWPTKVSHGCNGTAVMMLEAWLLACSALEQGESLLFSWFLGPRSKNGWLWHRKYVVTTAVLVGRSGRLDCNAREIPRHRTCLVLYHHPKRGIESSRRRLRTRYKLYSFILGAVVA